MSEKLKPAQATPGYTPHSIESSARACFALSLAGLGAILSISAYRFGPEGPLFYWGILPGAPFVLLAICAFIPQIPLRVSIGAATGALFAVALPYGSLLYASANYAGGGANIGLGLLLLAIPVYLPVAMLLGGVAGYFLKR